MLSSHLYSIYNLNNLLVISVREFLCCSSLIKSYTSLPSTATIIFFFKYFIDTMNIRMMVADRNYNNNIPRNRGIEFGQEI